MEQKYLIFKIGSRNYAIERHFDLELEPTQINRTTKTKVDSLIETILYKGKEIKVLDLGKIFDDKKVKKFDGLIFCSIENKSIAIKIEGIYTNSDFIRKDFIVLKKDLIESYLT